MLRVALRKLARLEAIYSAEGEIESAVKQQKFDMRGMSSRLKNVILYDDEIIDKRWAECEQCEFLMKPQNQCSKCKCFMKMKTRVATAKCPLNPPRWDKEYEFIGGKRVNGS